MTSVGDRDIMSRQGDVQYTGVSIQIQWFTRGLSHIHHGILQCTQDNPHCTHDIPWCTEHPSVYVLHRHYAGLLYGADFNANRGQWCSLKIIIKCLWKHNDLLQ